MRIDSVRKHGRMITISGSFQPEDFRQILDMADAGTLKSFSPSGLTPVPADRLGMPPQMDADDTAAAEHNVIYQELQK